MDTGKWERTLRPGTELSVLKLERVCVINSSITTSPVGFPLLPDLAEHTQGEESQDEGDGEKEVVAGEEEGRKIDRARGRDPFDGDLEVADAEVVHERAADQRADARADAGRQGYSRQVGGRLGGEANIFMRMVVEAMLIPALAMPMRTCRTTSRGIVRVYLSGSVVKVQPRMTRK